MDPDNGSLAHQVYMLAACNEDPCHGPRHRRGFPLQPDSHRLLKTSATNPVVIFPFTERTQISEGNFTAIQSNVKGSLSAEQFMQTGGTTWCARASVRADCGTSCRFWPWDFQTAVRVTVKQLTRHVTVRVSPPDYLLAADTAPIRPVPQHGI